MKPIILASGKRKYVPILEELLASGKCAVTCPRVDTKTIIDGVKKEKVIWAAKGKIPLGKILKIELTELGVDFRLVTDTSINNL
jgi:hypothetical protein